MNPNYKKTQIELEETFQEFASLVDLSEKEKEAVFKNLEKSINLNVIGKILEQLSEDDKLRLEETKFEKSEDLITFLGKTIPKDKLLVTLEESTKEVIEKFLRKF